MKNRKLMNEAIKACEAAGLRHEPNHKHPRIVNPNTKQFITFSNTPSCPFAHTHMLRDVRKYLGVRVKL